MGERIGVPAEQKTRQSIEHEKITGRERFLLPAEAGVAPRKEVLAGYDNINIHISRLSSDRLVPVRNAQTNRTGSVLSR